MNIKFNFILGGKKGFLNVLKNVGYFNLPHSNRRVTGFPLANILRFSFPPSTVGINPILSDSQVTGTQGLQNWTEGILNTIKLIGMNSRFGLIQKQKWLKNLKEKKNNFGHVLSPETS